MVAGLANCGNQHRNQAPTFTHADSVTDTYLALQDSMLHAWNVMINDEKEKVQSLREVLNGMAALSEYDPEGIQELKDRLDQLERIRFTQNSLGNAHVIDEYDFASSSLISEILSQAELDPKIIGNERLQRKVDQIKSAEQRVESYRTDYDHIVERFNRFIHVNQSVLRDIDHDIVFEDKPLFETEEDQH